MKVVVRHLPPNLPLETFEQSLADYKYNVLYYVPGKSKRNKSFTHGRCYLDFDTMEKVMEFHKFYDHHLFVDGHGAHYVASVEMAPYRISFKPIKREDRRMNTIEQDADYQNFVESLNAPPEPIPVASELPAPIKTTPLLEFLKKKGKNKEIKKVQSMVVEIKKKTDSPVNKEDKKKKRPKKKKPKELKEPNPTPKEQEHGLNIVIMKRS